MNKNEPPVTAATIALGNQNALESHKMSLTTHLYHYQDGGGTKQSAQALGAEQRCSQSLW
jgi:hypothetical protein